MVRSHPQKKRKNTKAGSRPATKSMNVKKNMARTTLRAPLRMYSDADFRCAKHYAETVMNPFDTTAGACVPIQPCLDSAKRKIFARGIGHVQPNGFGAINCTTSLVNDIPVVRCTDGTGTGHSMSGTAITTTSNNSELLSSDFTNSSVQARIVGLGLRIRYIGKQIDMNGTVYSLEESSHLSTDLFTTSNLLAYDKVKTVPFNREWVVASWQPVLPAETAFSANEYASPYPTAVTPLIIMIQCQAAGLGGAQLPFEWEWFAHYEAIGAAARGKTASHLAPIAGPNVMAALQKAPSRLFDQVSNHKISINKVSNHMIEAGSSWGLGDTAMRVANTAIGAITSRAASQYMSGGLMALSL